SALVGRVLQPGQTFLDVGANIGYYTLLAATIVGPAGSVIAVEPNPGNCALLRDSADANGLNNITLHEAAAGDLRGALALSINGSNGAITIGSDRRGALDVTAIALDDVIDGPVHCMKFDIEGYEPFALAGLAQTICDSQPAIITEFHPWWLRRRGIAPGDFLDQLGSFGYTLSLIEADGSVSPCNSEALIGHWTALNDDRAHLNLFGTSIFRS
ncbi:MAG TPA: FkbM family methyltransferase, partial [Blastocatellia bacterium]|nr:FkbM family methyltransferase [Blastocatellia bacterium]